MEPHICVVANRTNDHRGEYVEIANADTQSVALTGLELTDYTGTQKRPHIYHFPRDAQGGTLYLMPGQVAYVFSSRGENARSDNGNFLLFWNLDSAVWNDAGDVAYLRRTDGTFVDSLTVGNPKRHPRGH